MKSFFGKIINKLGILYLTFQYHDCLLFNMMVCLSFDEQSFFAQFFGQTVLNLFYFMLQKVKCLLVIKKVTLLIFYICKLTYINVFEIKRQGTDTNVIFKETVNYQKTRIVSGEGCEWRLRNLIIMKDCGRGKEGKSIKLFC